MQQCYFDSNPEHLPDHTTDCYPVQIYGTHPYDPDKSSLASRSLINKIRDLGVNIDSKSLDLLTIATAVTSAETFVLRKDAPDAWSRQLELFIPVYDKKLWQGVAEELASVLGYLTGDNWKLNFETTQLELPQPKTSKKAKDKAKSLVGLNCVSLFSGGLDSAVGAIDMINGSNVDKPLLISHSYKGDGKKQKDIKSLLRGKYSEFSFDISPKIIKSRRGKTDVSMRGRSFNFIALAVLGVNALRSANNDDSISRIVIPENGYISLNPPLTRRRIGSHSTRTTHPFYISRLELLLNKVGFNISLENPYQMKTKGEMVSECVDKVAIKKAVVLSVSCSNWHRKHIQCGRCVPCLIRRAAVFKAGFTKDAPYDAENLGIVKKYKGERDDLLAVSMAINKYRNTEDFKAWIRQSGSLPQDRQLRDQLADVAKRGLLEVEQFLKSRKVK
ncbi:hypothetical protein HJ059_02360 [Vibrio parahaemolyticus]|uniref:Qat anti-phage system QueC-like protein QatC n=1 Tax=Vibrio TaxID=662 RepID=UPI00042102BE|nr:Qat anti-phage system QueC-like protein QatC [Vibrio parahaemolyticus]MBE4009750.1 hypothetical protein [Vibrio parahaemolyticus]MBE4346459.1 hypothetical protein [Vibrio parahaemolyticus]MDF4748137.1 hypothetical protein [Vibrio parahaemolyticus]MDF5665117.1 hypothetical protein [Vibrio parahaemolyticus]MDG2640140.1 hypothetical protein [Vibrio parahaemolyticus]